MSFFSGYRVNNKRRRIHAVRTARHVPTQIAPRPSLAPMRQRARSVAIEHVEDAPAKQAASNL